MYLSYWQFPDYQYVDVFTIEFVGMFGESIAPPGADTSGFATSKTESFEIVISWTCERVAPRDFVHTTIPRPES